MDLGDPADHELPDRLAGVAATVYLLFNEGYSAARPWPSAPTRPSAGTWRPG
jgi:predicted RNA polymerase sigma factor